ncbi:TetR/AcrR family transcriptional regulator [Lactobacillus sp. Sy-1]|uniref:TetR/AcrR family transcriptional regulator n=1 Tax=Lactobacillus sp. Sy-1 TaxID=2109645 RepID=UPI001C5ADE7A|nr:TetR/AcrR family transcriptional regulator [Lactobacillus sp. Sy-1]MBW1606419.1 TetR/AcrR family transcriptional regulator [Lactobacillus sp. Sy-1]
MATKRTQTINKIIDATIKLSQANGFNRITVSQIIREVGINRGTFYRYFRDKNDIFDTIENQILDQITEYQEQLINLDIHSIRNQLISGAFINQIVNLFDTHRAVLILLLSDNGDINFSNKLERFFTKMNQKTIAKLNFTVSDKQKHIITVFLTGAVLSLLKLHLLSPAKYTEADISKASYELIRDNLIHKL